MDSWYSRCVPRRAPKSQVNSVFVYGCLSYLAFVIISCWILLHPRHVTDTQSRLRLLEVGRPAENPKHPLFDAPTTSCGFESQIVCKDLAHYNQTCFIRNAYYNNESRWEVRILKDTVIPEMFVDAWGQPECCTGIKVRRFDSMADLLQSIEGTLPVCQPGLTVYFIANWHQNWAHALFDGLYAAYVGLAKFGRHRETFRPFAAISRVDALGCSREKLSNMACSMEEAFRLFGSLGDESKEFLIEYAYFSKASWSIFEELIIGSGSAGERAAVVKLPGVGDFKYFPTHFPTVLDFYVDRLYAAHGVRRAHHEDRAARQLQAVIGSNKRFSSNLTATLQQVVSQSKDVNIQILDWKMIPIFRVQLRFFRDVNIYISGVGTGLFWSALLPPGSVTINLGQMVQIDDKPNVSLLVPTYGEEYMCASNMRTRTLYLELEKVIRGPSVDDILALVTEAVNLVKRGFPIPQPSWRDNLSIFGKVVDEAMRRSEQTRLSLSGLYWSSGVLEANLTRRHTCRPSDPAHGVSGIALGLTPHGCGVDELVLGQVAREFGLQGVANLTSQAT